MTLSHPLRFDFKTQNKKSYTPHLDFQAVQVFTSKLYFNALITHEDLITTSSQQAYKNMYHPILKSSTIQESKDKIRKGKKGNITFY